MQEDEIMPYQFNLTRWCPPLSDTIRRMANDPQTEIVKMGISYGEGHIVSPHPLFTTHIFNCNVVVLFGTEYGAMSHYPWLVNDPRNYVSTFVDEVMDKSKSNGLEAVVISGDTVGHEIITEELDKKGIDIRAEFCDDFPTLLREDFGNAILRYLTTGKECASYEGLAAELGEKFVLAIPKTREVLLYSTATKVGSRVLTR